MFVETRLAVSQRLRSSDGRDGHALSLQAESASLEAGWNKITRYDRSSLSSISLARQ